LSALGGVVIVIDDLGIGDGSGVLDDGAADRVDPILLLLLGVGDEVHGVGARGELEGVGLVEDVFGAFDGEARGDGDHAAWTRRTRDGGVLEPEELALLEDEPAAAPGLDVLALLGEPAGPLGVRPELDAVVIGGVVRHAGCRAPQARHRSSKMRGQRKRINTAQENQRKNQLTHDIALLALPLPCAQDSLSPPLFFFF